VIPQVAASERGGAQTARVRPGGVVGRGSGLIPESYQTRRESKAVESAARDGESPVDEHALDSLTRAPEYHGTRETLWESGGTTLQG
jgi:hypothetical protein